MSKIKSSGTSQEMMLAKAFKKKKLRFVRGKNIFGNPDFVLKEAKIAVFCDGKFWHGYRFNKWKKNLAPFWLKKIATNRKRDRKVNKELKKQGWKILRFWDFEIKKDLSKCLMKIEKALRK
jgi:DNA mismatch endonuclease (patch repair protein)